MTRYPRLLCQVVPLARTLLILLMDAWCFLRLCLRPSPTLAAENLSLRRQLTLWHQALVIVQPATLIRWHRQGFRLFWRWTSRRGRPPIPPALQALIRQMARENPTWGQERIANELFLKLGLCVSLRTVRKYLPTRLDHGWHQRIPSQRWLTFVHNHANAIVACEFCTVVTVSFRLLYVFVV